MRLQPGQARVKLVTNTVRSTTEGQIGSCMCHMMWHLHDAEIRKKVIERLSEIHDQMSSAEAAKAAV